MRDGVPTLLHIYPTFDLGGAQRRFVQLANHFGGRFRHLIVSMDGASGAFHLLDRQIDAEMVSVSRRASDTWGSVRTFRKVLKTLRPDLLVTSNWGSIEWAMANLDGGIRHLHMEDGFGPEEAERQIPRRVWTRRLLLRRSTVMLPSLTLFRLAREVWRLPERVLVHVPNGIDCQRFSPVIDAAYAASFGISADCPVIGTVAALRPEKNVGRLFDAFALVCRSHRAQLVIVGDGPQRGLLEARAVALGIADRVIFTGACSSPERLLPSFSVFALSSDTEQMPLSLLEAMAAGRAVVATDVGDVRQMLSSENAPFVVLKDATQMANAIIRLLEDRDLRESSGSANMRRAKDVFDETKMFFSYQKLYGGTEF
jgi:glycosyltransferase involved in cell wall biosynthesis